MLFTVAAVRDRLHIATASVAQTLWGEMMLHILEHWYTDLTFLDYLLQFIIGFVAEILGCCCFS